MARLSRKQLVALLAKVAEGYEALLKSDYQGPDGNIIGGVPDELVLARKALREEGIGHE